MTSEFVFYNITELPSINFDTTRVFESIGRKDFVLFYDMERSITLLGFKSDTAEDTKNKIVNGIPGINLISTKTYASGLERDLSLLSVYRKADKFESKFFNDAFDTLPKSGFIAILFLNAGEKEIDSCKLTLEKILSSKDVRESDSSFRLQMSSKINSTTHRDLYYDSEEKLMLNTVIDSLNKAMLSNGLAYKIFIIIPKKLDSLRNYIDTHFLILAEYASANKKIADMINFLSNRPALPFGLDYCKDFLNFYGYYDTNHILNTPIPLHEEGLNIGTFVRDGVSETGMEISVDSSVINLGFIITGLPGSGKTREAMAVLDSIILENKNTITFIITPTPEWKDFALSHNMFFIKLYEDRIPINFFRCPNTINIEKFYTNLAMILSSAANAGPYQKPMEKCMLNAFRKIYHIGREPDPINVYNEIEESIIKYHGKRTSNGVKYTKHGENIKSSLENLRGIISKQQYCVKKGIRLEDLVEKGVIFDVSCTSGNTMTQLYALLLNQIYSIAANFDSNGDNQLRMVICLEEAQTIFKNPDSPAVEDIKQRIQDFRKQGIGLVLLAHNVTDIDIGIRRLCQLKLYLKQAPDTALIASKDLIFSKVEQDDVILKLKTLNSRIGAFSYVSKNGNDKRQKDTIFVKSRMYDNKSNEFWNPIDNYIKKNDMKETQTINCKLDLKLCDDNISKTVLQHEPHYLRIDFLGEEIATVPIDYFNNNSMQLLEGKEYSVYMLSKSNKILKKFIIYASAA